MEVDQKLILVESLSERISREKLEHVAAPLLKLHGFTPFAHENENQGVSVSTDPSAPPSGSMAPVITSTLNRLAWQSQVLDSVANRVESTLVCDLG